MLAKLKKVGWWKPAVFAGLALLILLIPVPAAATPPIERIIHLTASRFEYSPGTIRVNPGDQVTLTLAAADVVHGLSIDGYAGEITADPGQPQSLTFVADRSGTFRFRCTATCGSMHPFMIGKLQVGRNIFFWRAAALAGLVLLSGAWVVKK